MKKIKFSIIVPVYNVEKYIYKCIESILNQTYDNFELIVVNDGTKDKSIDVVMQFKDKRIKILNKKNGGLSDARNYGMKYATGDYVWFIDSDDYIESNALKEINKCLEKKEYDLIMFRLYDVIDGKDYLQNDRYYGYKDSRKFLMFVYATSRVFNRKFYVNNNFNFLKGVYYEDLELIPFILSKTDNIHYIDKGLYHHVMRDGSIMNSKKFSPNKDDKFKVLDSLFERFKKDGSYDKYKDELEYISIFHLISVYPVELFTFSRKIYLPRCKRIISYLDNMNNEWYKNKYLLQAPFMSRTITWLFRKKCFDFCACVIRLLKLVNIVK